MCIILRLLSTLQELSLFLTRNPTYEDLLPLFWSQSWNDYVRVQSKAASSAGGGRTRAERIGNERRCRCGSDKDPAGGIEF